MKNIVVDTDILIDFLRGREAARDFLSSLIDEATLYCSVIWDSVPLAVLKRRIFR
ncbi:MAG: hypothetical protein WAO55_15315 [Candidatus Manganitrophaceae bacterium]